MRLHVRVWTPSTVNRLPLRRMLTSYGLVVSGQFWMLMSLAGVCVDVAMGVVHNYPEQVPAYILLWVVCVADSVLWIRHGLRNADEGTTFLGNKHMSDGIDGYSNKNDEARMSRRTTQSIESDLEASSNMRNGNGNYDEEADMEASNKSGDTMQYEYMVMHRYVVAGYIALLIAHIGLGIYYSVLWVTASSSLGINIIKAPVTMSKALGHWVTFICVYLVLPARGVQYKISSSSDTPTWEDDE